MGFVSEHNLKIKGSRYILQHRNVHLAHDKLKSDEGLTLGSVLKEEVVSNPFYL